MGIQDATKTPRRSSLATWSRKLAAEWHPTRNGVLTPENVTRASGLKVWWRCAENPSHVWQAAIYSRSRTGKGCPFCAGYVATPQTSLRARFPAVVAEWHATKNGALTPGAVMPGSGRKVWWRCSKPSCRHVWQASIGNRSRGNGCPACANRTATRKNSLAALFPGLSRQWHPTKNGALTPEQTVPRSSKTVWWRCAEDRSHEWRTAIVKRTIERSGCPFCSGRVATPKTSMAALYPAVAREWHPSKNGALKPTEVRPGTEKRVWWRCRRDPSHEWQAYIHSRTRPGARCPMCVRTRVTPATSLRATHPELAAQWHPSKNGGLGPEEVLSGSDRRVWWQCPKDRSHAWQAAIASRAGKGNGCPICRGLVPTPGTTLRARFPRIAAEWHPEKNDDRTPGDVTFHTGRQFWWRCRRDPSHAWITSVVSRTLRESKCPACTGRTVTTSNSLRTVHPKIARDWHPTKNGDLQPEQVTARSTRAIWWTCPKDRRHEWRTTIYKRTKAGSGCPVCLGRRASPLTSLRARSPALAAEWHTAKNAPLSPDDVVPGSNKRVWWRCSVRRAHVWEAKVVDRARRGRGCPLCRGMRKR
jgi:Probable Zinc-ribbon domain